MMPQTMTPQPGMPESAPAGQLDQTMLQKVVMAGQRLMYDQSTRAYFINDLKKQGDPTDNLTAAVVGIIRLLDDKSKGKLPRQIIAPVAISLLIEAAHFAAEAGYFVMQKSAIAQAAKKIIIILMQKYGAAAQGGPGPVGVPPSGPPAAGGLIQSAQGAM